MTRQAPASGLVLRWYDDKAYNVHDRTTGSRIGSVIAWYAHWTAYDVNGPSGRSIGPELANGRTRSDALAAAWPALWPTRPAEPPGPVGGQSGEGDRPNGPQNDAQTGVA